MARAARPAGEADPAGTADGPACGGLRLARRDLVALAVAGGGVLAALLLVEPMRWIDPWLHRHEHWHAGEILLFALLTPLGAAWYAWRRGRDLKREIAARETAEARARALAHRDHLTDLANRARVSDHLAGALEDAAREGSCVGVIHFDLDYFKHVNDTLGHDVGDALLRHVAGGLARASRSEDLAARLGGDEFLVVLKGLGSAEAAADAARRIHRAVSRPLHIEDKLVPVSVSAGLAVFPADGADAADLLKHSDLALYEAKHKGRGILEVFTGHMRAAVARERTMEAELARALQYQEFTVAFQPEVDARSGLTRGIEALVRWQHPTRGLVPAGVFLPVAVRSGQIVAIGGQILEMVAAIVGTWHREGLSFGTVGINVSVTELSQAHYAERFLSTIRSHGLRPDQVRVEVLETLFMNGAGGPARANLAALVEAGVQVVLDDFGSGFASLSKLSRETVNTIKIDRRFVERLDHCQETLRLVAMLVDMARFLGFEVVAEGVETDVQRRALVGMGCHVLQGHSIAPPLDWSEIRGWLDQRAANVVDASGKFGRKRR